MRRNSTVLRMSHLQYWERKCAVPGKSHLHYEEKVVQCEKESVQYQKGYICSRRTGCVL